MAPTCLGIEIGGTKLQLGLGAGDGSLIALRRYQIDPAAGAPGILGQIAFAVPGLLDSTSPDPVRAVGIGFGGPVDSDRGIVLKSHQVAGWDGFPLSGWARDVLGVEVVAIQNDADAAALGEARFGSGVGMSPILYITIGSGIGGGLVVDDRIYRGFGSGAVEIGHFWYVDPDRDDTIASRLEDVASGWAIGRAGRDAVRKWGDTRGVSRLVHLSGGDPDRVTGQMVFEAAERGDPAAVRIVDGAARAFGACLAHAVTLLAPRRVILGGGVSLSRDDLWIDKVVEEVNRLAFPPFVGQFDVVTASLREDVVVHGAIAIAADGLAAARGGRS